MFKVKMIVLGKFKEKAFLDLEKEYLKRLSVYAKFKIIEISEISMATNILSKIEKLNKEQRGDEGETVFQMYEKYFKRNQ